MSYKRVQSILKRKYHISFVSLIKQIVPSRFLLLEECINSVDVLDVIYYKYREKRHPLGEIQVSIIFLGDLGVARENGKEKKQKT